MTVIHIVGTGMCGFFVGYLLKKIINFSKKLGIYENPNELLSISLGSAETTLLKLTSAYSAFVNDY